MSTATPAVVALLTAMASTENALAEGQEGEHNAENVENVQHRSPRAMRNKRAPKASPALPRVSNKELKAAAKQQRSVRQPKPRVSTARRQ
mmetsp:Transcript_6528/g.19359  ORF Transcript_6528/g.19359 Transcript_6528/m.19359 type:complete len:90 (-) Transcript_6528:463-732(-)